MLELHCSYMANELVMFGSHGNKANCLVVTQQTT
jgi:hypothetical protein